MTGEEACSADFKTERRVYAFRVHDGQEARHALPPWPDTFSPEKFALLACGEEKGGEP
jgi:hypothetical protein